MGRAVGKQLYCFDFETESDCDLKACGSVVYSHHYSTEVICLCWNRVGEPDVGEWVPGALESTLTQLVEHQDTVFMAHNVGFEKAIWRNIMMPRYGYPDIPDDRWHDTMAVCAEKGLPLGLDEACRALRLPEQKDKAGSKFTIGLSKHTFDKTGMSKVNRPEDWRDIVIAYCHQDVAAEIALHKRIGWMEPKERDVWLLDQTINARGVAVDLAFVTAAQTIVRDAIAPLASQFMDATGLKFTQTAKLLAWFKARGLHIPNMQKGTLDSILGSDEHGHDDDIDWELFVPDMPEDLRRLLKIRQLIGSASIKKLDKMLECTWHGIAYNLLQYHGAGTGRWAGRLLQPQNFPRGVGRDMDHVVSAIMTGDHRYVDAVIGPPVEVVVGALRHALVSRPGKVFVVGDFAGIEARVVLACAGQHDKTALMAAGENPYIDMANQIFNRTDITKTDDIFEYTIGKNTVLGCGFGMGKDKFHLRYCPLQSLSFAERVIQTYRKEWAPEVPKLWYGLEAAVVKTVHDRTAHEAYGVEFWMERDGWLTARLPSGRKLWYYDPKPCTVHVPWDIAILKNAYTYGAQKTGHWQRVSGYGGLITENVVQALARDLMVHAMFICERENMPIVLTVHDEIVCEVDECGHDWAKMLQQIMEDRPQWAIDMQVPVTAECWQGDRYRK